MNVRRPLTSLALRLRLLLVAVATLLVAGTVAGVAFVERLRSTSDAILDRALPVADLLVQAESDAARLAALAGRIEAIAGPDGLALARQESATIVASLDASLDALAGEGTLDQRRAVAAQVEVMANIVADALEARGEVLAAEGATRAREAAALAAADAALARADPLLAAAALDLRGLPSPAEEAAEAGRLPDGVAGLQLAAELAIRTNGLRDAIATLAAQRTPSRIDGASATLNDRVLTLSTLVARLPPGPGTADLAGQVLAVRGVVADEGGLATQLRRAVAARDRTSQLRDRLSRETARLSALTSDLGARTAQGVEEASRQMDLLARRLQAGDLALRLVAGLGVLGIVALAFERQVIRRIAKVAEDVRALAAGDLSRDLTVTRADEIGAMEEALRTFRRNAQDLRRSNADLKDFAYAAAHDLRSPLRAIADLVDWTIEDHGDTLDAGARRNLETIRGRVQRLSKMLTGLLDYARAGHVADAPEPVDLAEVASDLQELLSPAGTYRITVAGPRVVPLPAVPVRTILHNLVDNAIKHHDRAEGEVRFGVEAGTDATVLEVRDDGPGIPADYHEKVFGLFQTLRPRDEVEGSGLGLALVRKLVQHLGGSIALASDPGRGRGTTFTIRIPLRPPGALA